MAETAELLGAWAQRAGSDDDAWRRARPGPSVDEVASRLSSAPRPFLDEHVSLPALAGDVMPGEPVRTSLVCLRFADDARVRLGGALALWLHASADLIEPFAPPLPMAGRMPSVDALALRLAPVTDPLTWLADDERREEAARTFLLWSGCLPAGETATTARSLLDARDSLRRNAALAEAYAEHRHRAAIARTLAEARAKEAAARYSSE